MLQIPRQELQSDKTSLAETAHRLELRHDALHIHVCSGVDNSLSLIEDKYRLNSKEHCSDLYNDHLSGLVAFCLNSSQ